MTRQLICIFAITFASVANGAQLNTAIVDVNWLNKNIDNVKILDIRKDLKSFSQKPKYRVNKKTGKKKLLKVGGHIPGARLIDYRKIRTTVLIDKKEVKKQVVPGESVQKMLRVNGIDKDDAIIITSKGEHGGDITMATRLYWTIKYYGHNNLAILDGGTAAWLLADKAINFDISKHKKGNWTAKAANKALIASTTDVEQALRSKTSQILDGRSMGQYLGTWRKSYVYKSGHVPGAKPFSYELIASPQIPAKFTPTEDLKKLVANLGISDTGNTITYCNSGHLASGSWFVLSEVLGHKNTKLYDGSMHEWTMGDREVTRFKVE